MWAADNRPHDRLLGPERPRVRRRNSGGDEPKRASPARA
jgi:hypothetical protein